MEEGADLLACETIPAVKEALALVHLVTTEFPASPAWISFSCRVRPCSLALEIITLIVHLLTTEYAYSPL